MDSTTPSPRARPRRPSKALARHGVRSVFVHVDYEGQVNQFTGGRYSHGTLALRDKSERHLLRAVFQRHSFARGSRDQPAEFFRPDPRFDYGLTPWSNFYSPRLDMTLDLAQPAMLADVTRLVTRLHALRRGEEFRAAGLVVPCELATHVNLLEWLGISVTLLHQLEHQRPCGLVENLATPPRLRARRGAAGTGLGAQPGCGATDLHLCKSFL